MNRIKQFVISHELRPRVVHRLPGRCRVHLPALRKLPEQMVHKISLLVRLMELPEGVQRVRADSRTGNVLIGYDPAQITEKEILDYLKVLAKIIGRYWDRLLALEANGELDNVYDRLESVIHQALQRKQVLCDNIEIPDYVWQKN